MFYRRLQRLLSFVAPTLPSSPQALCLLPYTFRASSLLLQTRLDAALLLRGLLLDGHERPKPAHRLFEPLSVARLQSLFALREPARGLLRVDELLAGPAKMTIPVLPEPVVRI